MSDRGGRWMNRGYAAALNYTQPPDIEADGLWTRAAVEGRLVEAARVIHRTAGRVGPRGYTPAWGIEVEAEALATGEKVGMLQAGELGAYEARLAAERNRYVMGVSQEEMTRVEEAMLWPMRYLEAYEAPRRALKLFLSCRAQRRRFGSACRARGWSRATAYRARDRALTLIAIGLTKDRVPVLLAMGEDDDDGDEE